MVFNLSASSRRHLKIFTFSVSYFQVMWEIIPQFAAVVENEHCSEDKQHNLAYSEDYDHYLVVLLCMQVHGTNMSAKYLETKIISINLKSAAHILPTIRPLTSNLCDNPGVELYQSLKQLFNKYFLFKVLCGRRRENIFPTKLENDCRNRRKAHGGKIHHWNSEYRVLCIISDL